MTNANLFKGVFFASTVLLSTITFSVQASECKGLDNETCSTNTACGWVEAYTRKDGREVNAFCRTSTKGRAKVSNGKEDSVKKVES